MTGINCLDVKERRGLGLSVLVPVAFFFFFCFSCRGAKVDFISFIHCRQTHSMKMKILWLQTSKEPFLGVWGLITLHFQRIILDTYQVLDLGNRK